MTEIWQPTTEPLVLHVIPTPVARGAQREARALADQLDAPGWRAHRLLTIFDGPGEVQPDLSLHADGGRSPAVGYDPRVVPRLRSALKRLDPALVVAHGSDPLKYLVPALAGTRRPLAYYAIGTYAGSRERRLQLRMWQRLVARADVVAAEGNEVKLECSELLGVPAAKVTMTPNGRDPGEFRPRRREDGAAPPVVTFVGALTDGKRPDRFIEVVTELRQRGFSFDAQLVGDGPLGPSLTGPAAQAGVELLGSRSDVADILGRSDVMVFPSRAAGEGMPGVLIEAGLSGVPVVATDVPGVTTIVARGETGLVVAPDDLGAMVEATARLLGEPGLRRDMAGAARIRCVERFSLEAVAATWLGLLAPLLPVGSVPAG